MNSNSNKLITIKELIAALRWCDTRQAYETTEESAVRYGFADALINREPTDPDEFAENVARWCVTDELVNLKPTEHPDVFEIYPLPNFSFHQWWISSDGADENGCVTIFDRAEDVYKFKISGGDPNTEPEPGEPNLDAIQRLRAGLDDYTIPPAARVFFPSPEMETALGK